MRTGPGSIPGRSAIYVKKGKCMLSLIVLLILVGLGMYIIELFLPIDRKIKQVIYILVGLWVVASLASFFGFTIPYLQAIR